MFCPILKFRREKNRFSQKLRGNLKFFLKQFHAASACYRWPYDRQDWPRMAWAQKRTVQYCRATHGCAEGAHGPWAGSISMPGWPNKHRTPYRPGRALSGACDVTQSHRRAHMQELPDESRVWRRRQDDDSNLKAASFELFWTLLWFMFFSITSSDY